MKRKRSKKERMDRALRAAEANPTVVRLRELEARGLAEIEANPGRWPEPPDPTMLNRLRRAREGRLGE
jgi:hypothetical protein